MSSKNNLSEFSRNLWLMLGMFALIGLTFGYYAYLGKQVEHTNESRLRSFLLVDELRQSSDDLTRMVRTYVVTGDPIYKQHYQEILDIREGRKPRPTVYNDIYWDLVLADDKRPNPGGQAAPLLEMMRQAGFTEGEFARLAEAKANSDALTRPEYAAMALIESTKPTTEANRRKAINMLNDAAYHQAKAGIMRPIDELYHMMEQRTLEVVRAAGNAVRLVSAMLIVFGLLLAFTIWRTYWALRATFDDISHTSQLIGESSAVLTTSSTELAATMVEHERTVGEQSASIAEISATAEELGASSRTSAMQSENTAALANQSQALTEEGIKQASRSISGIIDLKAKVGAVAGQILHLSEQVEQIGSIAVVVGELASETNMLALNAAVEAARAGEHGRGFAVVASEIRKLADQSKKSAERTRALVAEVQKATNSTVMATEEGIRAADEVAIIAKQSGESFTSLADVANKVYENAQQVMLNSKQQSSALTQVADAMKNLSNGAREIATGTVQAKIGVVKLNEVALSLKTLV